MIAKIWLRGRIKSLFYTIPIALLVLFVIWFFGGVIAGLPIDPIKVLRNSYLVLVGLFAIIDLTAVLCRLLYIKIVAVKYKMPFAEAGHALFVLGANPIKNRKWLEEEEFRSQIDRLKRWREAAEGLTRTLMAGMFGYRQ
ncbi:MAG: hypothetical protein BWY68_00232 [bacterium ADurb.Bin400]|nr:MAG: hypothetical protein BWY68_00232 [bacterium ADurb.Bin400]